MARPKSPDGRSVTHAVKLSEAESAAADALRGDVCWSEWLRALVVAAVVPGQPASVVPSPRGKPVNPIEPVNLNPDVPVNPDAAGIPVNQNVAVNQNAAPKRGRAVKVPPAAPVVADLVPASSLPVPRRCTHPGKRSVGGWCPDCDHLIRPGGTWA